MAVWLAVSALIGTLCGPAPVEVQVPKAQAVQDMRDLEREAELADMFGTDETPTSEPPPPLPTASAQAHQAVQAVEDELAPLVRERQTHRVTTRQLGLTQSSRVRPGTRRFFADAKVGAGIGIRHEKAAIQVEETFGVHISPESDGLAVTFVAQQAFREQRRAFTFAPRFEYDIQLGRVGVYASPSLSLGYRLLRVVPDQDQICGTDGYGCPDEVFETESHHLANLQAGLAFKFIVADRAVATLRPITFDVSAPGFSMRWQLMAGVGVTF